MNHERLYFFFIEIWPQEVYYITGLLILAAVSLFLINAAVRAALVRLFLPADGVDRSLHLGRDPHRRRPQRAHPPGQGRPGRTGKIAKRVSKHTIWLLSLGRDGRRLGVLFHRRAQPCCICLFTGTATFGTYATVAGFTFTTYALGGLMREQVCTYMCPWPRIQAAMTDSEALSVTYRRDRGEPRGAHKKGEPWEGRGDCIDCNQCVAACPMGIDIRDGAQLECINCALCIDACDDVMRRVDRPLGLIAFDTEANVLRRLKGEKARFRFVRPRTILYAAW